jgi:hypothetical protein
MCIDARIVGTYKKISILIPFYNEEDVLPILFERIDNFGAVANFRVRLPKYN